MRILGLATAVLVTMASVCKGATYTYNFTGTAGTNVPGWSSVPGGTYTNTGTFKYDGSGNAEITVTDANQDHAWYADGIGTSSTVEILAKWKSSYVHVGGVMNMGVFLFADTGIGEFLCQTGLLNNAGADFAAIYFFDGTDNGLDACTSPTNVTEDKAPTFLVEDTWFISRMRYNTITGDASLQMWRASEPDPADWLLTIPYFPAGTGQYLAGVFIDPVDSMTATLTVDWVVITTSGETAANPETPTTSRRVFTVTD